MARIDHARHIVDAFNDLAKLSNGQHYDLLLRLGKLPRREFEWNPKNVSIIGLWYVLPFVAVEHWIEVNWY